MKLMQQVVLRSPLDLRVESVPVPTLSKGDLLLKVDRSLLCGTDVRIFEGRKSRNVTFPTVLGHELAGRIVDSAGPIPEGIDTETLFSVYPLVPCGSCVACLKGHENICRNRVAFGYQLPGGLSQYIRVPAEAVKNLVPVPGVTAGEAALVEPVACAYNGQQLAEVAHAESVLVVGCGPLGLIHIRLARTLGVAHVAAIDPIAERRNMAARSGAELVAGPGADTAELIRDWQPGGVDVLVMAIGRTDALTPYLCCLAPGARVSVFAGFAADAELVVLANDVHYNEWTFVGASSCRLDGFHSVAALIASGRLEVRDLLGSEFRLEDAPQALSAAASGTDLRVGINPWLN